jgi:predicted nucleic acid-binding protein
MQVVSNTSPLSALSIIGRLGLLHMQFRTIRIPKAVWTELSRLDHESGKQALEQAHAEGWIEVHETANRPMVGILGVTLDAGESEAIAMSLEWPTDLLIMDESSGRAMARKLKIRITGTLGVLLKAKRDGQIHSLKLEMDRLVQEAGFFVSDRVRNTFLAEAGEGP